MAITEPASDLALAPLKCCITIEIGPACEIVFGALLLKTRLLPKIRMPSESQKKKNIINEKICACKFTGVHETTKCFFCVQNLQNEPKQRFTQLRSARQEY